MTTKEKNLVDRFLHDYTSKSPHSSFTGEDAKTILKLLDDGILEERAFPLTGPSATWDDENLVSISQNIYVYPLTEKGKKKFGMADSPSFAKVVEMPDEKNGLTRIFGLIASLPNIAFSIFRATNGEFVLNTRSGDVLHFKGFTALLYVTGFIFATLNLAAITIISLTKKQVKISSKVVVEISMYAGAFFFILAFVLSYGLDFINNNIRNGQVR